jgi:uncharacterized protein (DUF305 family)
VAAAAHEARGAIRHASTHTRQEIDTMKKIAALVATLAALLALAGCGDDEPASDDTRTASNGDEFNDADVAFATDMIPHHAQALSMVDLTLGRPLDPEVERLAEDIREAQAPEIEQMTDWLTSWDEPVPATMRDHSNADSDTDMDMGDMPGMMSAEDMTALEAASDAEFQDMFLEMMIEHHEGAVEMAKTEQSDGLFKPAIDLAEAIESSQTDEIEQMQDLLGS